MGLQWFDGFDTQTSTSLATAGLYELSNAVATITSGAARTGAGGCQLGSAGAAGILRKNLLGGGNYPTMIIGGAYAIQSSGWQGGVVASSQLMGWVDNGTVQTTLNADALGRLQFYRSGSVPLAGTQSTYQLPFNQFHYIEAEVTIHPSAGSVIARVDGATVVSVGGLNTQSSANSYSNQAQWGNLQWALLDDIYVVDTGTGGAPLNTFLGDCSVVEYVPSATGSFSQWTQGGTTHTFNYQQVNEIPADGNGTYNASSTNGNRDSFGFPSYPPASLVNPGLPVAVLVLVYGETDATGSRIIQLTARESGTDAFSPNIVEGLGYAYQYWLRLTDVNGNAWSVGHLNATEFGYVLIA